MAEFHGLPSGVGRRIVVLASRFNEPIVKKLVDGALEALIKYGVAFEDIDVIWVPGAWELPIAARWLLASERYDGLVAFAGEKPAGGDRKLPFPWNPYDRSEEHTSELQSLTNLVCRLLLEK